MEKLWVWNKIGGLTAVTDDEVDTLQSSFDLRP